MAKEKYYSRAKVAIDDQYERFVENERFSGVSLTYNSNDNRFDVTIPQERKRSNEQPDKMSEGEKTAMYFSKRRTGGYGFQLTVNLQLFKAIGEDAIVEEFAKCLHVFMDQVAN